MKRDKIIATIHEEPDVIQACLAGSDKTFDHDQKLRLLTVSVGCLAALLVDPGWSRNHLSRIYGLCTGWLLALGEETPSVRICAERERQEDLFKQGKHLFTCASHIVDPVRKLRVLLEEVGEVANEIDAIESCEAGPSICKRHLPTLRKNLKAEITQVAAVAVAWLESL